MRSKSPQARIPSLTLVPLVLLLSTTFYAQSTASFEGQITDQTGAVVPAVEITAVNQRSGIERSTVSDDAGRYQIAALPVGDYRVVVKARGFHTQVLESVRVEVGRRLTQDFQLQVGEASEQVTVTSTNGLIDHASVSVGQVIGQRTVQELPLNGRHFIDLGLLVPGSVTPPQNGFLSSPARGQGSFALNTAGNREETVNFQINGVNLNDQINNIITLLPPISSIQEFKVDNSTFSAEYGRNSGAIVNIATRQGSNDFHGELFEFFRNDALDARNFFTLTSNQPPPFKRNQYGGAIGGPVVLPRFGEGGPVFSYDGKNRTFFYFSFEGLRQRQAVN